MLEGRVAIMEVSKLHAVDAEDQVSKFHAIDAEEEVSKLPAVDAKKEGSKFPVILIDAEEEVIKTTQVILINIKFSCSN